MYYFRSNDPSWSCSANEPNTIWERLRRRMALFSVRLSRPDNLDGPFSIKLFKGSLSDSLPAKPQTCLVGHFPCFGAVRKSAHKNVRIYL